MTETTISSESLLKARKGTVDIVDVPAPQRAGEAPHHPPPAGGTRARL